MYFLLRVQIVIPFIKNIVKTFGLILKLIFKLNKHAKLVQLVGFPPHESHWYLFSLPYSHKIYQNCIDFSFAPCCFCMHKNISIYCLHIVRKTSKPLVYEQSLTNTKLKAADYLILNMYNIKFLITCISNSAYVKETIPFTNVKLLNL